MLQEMQSRVPASIPKSLNVSSLVVTSWSIFLPDASPVGYSCCRRCTLTMSMTTHLNNRLDHTQQPGTVPVRALDCTGSYRVHYQDSRYCRALHDHLRLNHHCTGTTLLSPLLH